jgi:hypothetical protein
MFGVAMTIRTKQATENNREHNTPSTTYMPIKGTHAIPAVSHTRF